MSERVGTEQQLAAAARYLATHQSQSLARRLEIMARDFHQRYADLGVFHDPAVSFDRCPFVTCLENAAALRAESAELAQLRQLASAVAAFMPLARLPDHDPRRAAAERELEDCWVRMREADHA